MSENLIEKFVDNDSLKALKNLIESTSDNAALSSSVQLADIFDAGQAFKEIADKNSDAESKLVSSFNNNLVLLIQKTWVEKSDEELKAQILYQLEEFPEKFFRRRILCDTPAIRSSVSVLHIDEIRDADIALHLQPRDARLKTGVAALAVVQSLFQPFGKHPAFTGYGFIKLLVLVGRQAVIPTGVKVIAVTPEVRKVWNPLPTHKSSLLVEKFAVKTFAAPRSRSFPFPRTIYIIRKP